MVNEFVQMVLHRYLCIYSRTHVFYCAIWFILFTLNPKKINCSLLNPTCVHYYIVLGHWHTRRFIFIVCVPAWCVLVKCGGWFYQPFTKIGLLYIWLGIPEGLFYFRNKCFYMYNNWYWEKKPPLIKLPVSCLTS